MPISIFICYARKDEALLNELKTHLKPLQRQGLIRLWYDRDISIGTKWEPQIMYHLNTAQVVLLLVSPDFMNSDYCYSIEMKRALERHESRAARVIPIILRPVFWHGKPLGELQALPTDGKPVTTFWQDRDAAFYDITQGLYQVVKQLMPAPLPVEKLAVLRTLTGHKSSVECVAISPDGQTLVSGGWDHAIKVWELSTGHEVRTLTGNTGIVWSVAISPDGQTLVSASHDTVIKVWELSTGREVRTLTGHTGCVNSVAISPDGQTLISGGCDDAIKVWKLSTNCEVRTLTGHTGCVNSVAISADGQTVVSGSDDNTIKMWDLSADREVHTLTGRKSSVLSVAISPDGQTVVSGSTARSVAAIRGNTVSLERHDEMIKVWDLSTGREVCTLTGHTGAVCSVAISPDGQTVVSGSDDKTIKVWDLSTGKEVRTLTGHTGRVCSVAISADGQTLVSGSADNTIKMWGA